MATATPAASSRLNKSAFPRRRDRWWIAPLVSGAVLLTMGLYGLWAAAQGDFYKIGGYHSPLYSPEIHIAGWPFSPAFLILWAPLGFRITCYYYRKAYYRAFFWNPPGCAVPGVRAGYQGETRIPFIFQNLHRYFLYLAIIYIAILTYDAVLAFNFGGRFGIGLGTLIMVANVILLAGYTFSCHSFRHLVGGNVDCFSCARGGALRHSLWQRITGLNSKHMQWAWASLIVVMGTDLYIRLVAMGIIADPVFIRLS